MSNIKNISIHWDELRYAIGRNGMSKCKGLHIELYSSTLSFYPINSKGNITNCRVPIPIYVLDELIENLTLIKESYGNSNIDI